MSNIHETTDFYISLADDEKGLMKAAVDFKEGRFQEFCSFYEEHQKKGNLLKFLELIHEINYGSVDAFNEVLIEKGFYGEKE